LYYFSPRKRSFAFLRSIENVKLRCRGENRSRQLDFRSFDQTTRASAWRRPQRQAPSLLPFLWTPASRADGLVWFPLKTAAKIYFSTGFSALRNRSRFNHKSCDFNNAIPSPKPTKKVTQK
jgi:hypothetical protein